MTVKKRTRINGIQWKGLTDQYPEEDTPCIVCLCRWNLIENIHDYNFLRFTGQWPRGMKIKPKGGEVCAGIAADNVAVYSCGEHYGQRW